MHTMDHAAERAAYSLHRAFAAHRQRSFKIARGNVTCFTMADKI
jgi:hypothetical protein